MPWHGFIGEGKGYGYDGLGLGIRLDWTFGSVWVGVEPRIKVRVIERSRVRVTI